MTPLVEEKPPEDTEDDIEKDKRMAERRARWGTVNITMPEVRTRIKELREKLGRDQP